MEAAAKIDIVGGTDTLGQTYQPPVRSTANIRVTLFLDHQGTQDER